MSRSVEVEAALDRVSELLQRQIGLRPEPAARGRLLRCVRDDALNGGQDLDAYVDTLLTGGEALQDLLNSVTVQETAFFRHPEHFDLLAREILPTLRPAVTLWSAGCANGQEAFSLAMLLEEQGIDGCVVASDLSTEALRRTRAARYSTRELSGLSPDRIARHLTRDPDGWVVNRDLRDRVSILRHNLVGQLPDEVRGCQVIFCRNVLIYFSPEHARAFLDKVADGIPAASLFLGAAETIWQLSSRFETVRSGETFSYRPRAERSVRETDRLVPIRRPAATPVAAAVAEPADAARMSGRRVAVAPAPSPAVDRDLVSAGQLAGVGQQASASGDVQAAVVAFRKCAYLVPDDPMAHLHLGLALDSAGDQTSAQRAYAAARRALAQTDPARIAQAAEGYSAADLIRLLDTRQHVVAP